MVNQNNSKTSNFWFGFSLGILGTSTLIYLFGTKKGRETMKKVLDLTENLEDNLAQITEELDQLSVSESKESTKKVASTIGSILNKVNSLTH